MSQMQNIAVVYASLAGSAQRVAEQVQQSVQTRLPNAQVELLDMLVANPDALPQYDFVFMGASTYGEGDLNPFAEIFVASLSGRESEQIWAGLPFAVFALGDSSYIQFCWAADHLEKCVIAHGGQLETPTLRIDVLTQDWDEQVQVIDEWVNNFV